MYYDYDNEEYDSEYDCDCYESDRDDCEAYHEQRWRDYKKKKTHKGRKQKCDNFWDEIWDIEHDNTW